MLIFFQEIGMQLFLWLLKMVDGLMEIFSAISGVATVNYHGQEVNILDLIVGDSTVAAIFWCIFILAVGLTCIFTIIALVKNMIANNRNISSIVGKFFLALLGTLCMLAVVFLGIMIAGAVLHLLANIFQVSNTTKLSNAIFNACVGDWLNGYNINNVDITSMSVDEIFGSYSTVAFGIWPKSWKCNGIVDPNTFMYLPALISGVALSVSLLIAVLNLAKRIYEIVFLYFCMPASMSTLPLDDGARFKNWREQFVTKIILAYGAVLSVNIFVLILPFIVQMSLPNVSGFANAMFRICMIVGGAMLIPAGQSLFARLFGQADDMHAGGGFLRSAFYGGRIVSGMTIGLATKGIKGIVHAVRHNKNSDNSGSSDSGGSADDSGDKYTESGSGSSDDSSSDSGAETTEGGETS